MCSLSSLLCALLLISTSVSESWCSSSSNTRNIQNALSANAEQQQEWNNKRQATPTVSDYDACESDIVLFADPNTGNSSALYYHTINWQQIPMAAADSADALANTWFVDGSGASNISGYLTTYPIQLPSDPSKAILLSFRHKFDTERGYDGCMVYYTTDSQTWRDLGPFFVEGEYNFQMFSQNGALPAFTGTQDYFNNTIADISELRGQAIQISFVFMSDFSLPSVGWWVNNVKLYTANCPTVAGDDTPTRPAVDPTQPSSPNPSQPNTSVPGSTTTMHSDTDSIAVAALITSIVVAVVCLISIIIMLSVYYDWKKKHQHRDPEVPMVKITTNPPFSQTSSTTSLNGSVSSNNNATTTTSTTANRANLPPNPRATK